MTEIVENLLRPYTLADGDLDAGYAALAADAEREAEAREWIESWPDDGLEELEDDDWSWLPPPT